jgi:hypothetical protein
LLPIVALLQYSWFTKIEDRGRKLVLSDQARQWTDEWRAEGGFPREEYGSREAMFDQEQLALLEHSSTYAIDKDPPAWSTVADLLENNFRVDDLIVLDLDADVSTEPDDEPRIRETYPHNIEEDTDFGLEEGIEKFQLIPNRVQALMHMRQRQQQVHECIQSTGASPVSVALRNRHEDYDVTILMALRNPLLYRDEFLMEEQSIAGLDKTLMLQTELARVPCRGIVNLRTLDGLFEKHANPLSVVKVRNHVLQMQWTEECLFLMDGESVVPQLALSANHHARDLLEELHNLVPTVQQVRDFDYRDRLHERRVRGQWIDLIKALRLVTDPAFAPLYTDDIVREILAIVQSSNTPPLYARPLLVTYIPHAEYGLVPRARAQESYLYRRT